MVSNFQMYRQTDVQSENGKVRVSTRSGASSLNRFETMVFALDEEGHITHPTLAEAYTSKPKQAKRTHRRLCHEFDAQGRFYEFNPKLANYAPIKQ